MKIPVTSVQTSLLKRRVRWRRSAGPPIAGSPIAEHWDAVGTIEAVYAVREDNLLRIAVLWPDGALRDDLTVKWFEILPEE